MPSAMYDRFFFLMLGTGTETAGATVTDYLTNPIHTTLHTATYVPDKAVHDFADDAVAEVAAGGGYAAGGLALASKTLALASGVITANAADPSWPNSTITARHAIFSNRATTTAATQPLIIYYSATADVSSNNGTFTVDIPAGGLFTITIPAPA